MIGTGVGWLQEEFAAQGIPWERRAARTEEYIAVWRAFWSEEHPSFHGEFVDFAPVHATPKPVTPGGPPVHIGGHALVGARRAGRIGDGYFPTIYPNSRVKELFPQLLAEMRGSAEDAGRDPRSIEVTFGGARTAETAKWYADLGVHRLLIKARSVEARQLRDELMQFGDEVIAATVDL
jgi:alkanesulfonate monooxygenase SsuD/methylene tetrahydromethanopterin reductase-like flavin-dependent oxidoreductase (luciferase family)